MPRYSLAGTWGLSGTIYDTAGTYTSLPSVPAQVADSTPESSGPQLISLTMPYYIVPHTAGGGTIDVYAQLSDNLSGVSTVDHRVVCFPSISLTSLHNQYRSANFVPLAGNMFKA